MKIAMIGSGYVGLVSGACFASCGHSVVCVDSDAAKVAALERGEMPIYEPGLAELVAHNRQAGRLSFSRQLGRAVGEADLVFIAVGTPSRRGDGHADLSYVYAAAADIADHARAGAIIVTKSTVPVGTGDEIQRIVQDVRNSANVEVVSNPEFLREGAAIDDFMRPDRVIIGAQSEAAVRMMRSLYAPLGLADEQLLVMTRRAAELTKYAANGFLATKIGFINEIADLCEKAGVDVSQVSRGIGSDRRIGPQFLQAGPGYGGSCFPKDTLALLKTSEDFDAPQRIIEAVVSANECRKRAMGRKVIAALGGDVRGKTISILGLTFKAGTDDMRDSPSIPIIRVLQDHGANIRAYDPQGEDQARRILTDVSYCSDPYDASRDAAAAVVVTEWPEFRTLDLKRMARLMDGRVLVDLRNVVDAAPAHEAGLDLYSVGAPSSPAHVQSLVVPEKVEVRQLMLA